MYNSNKLKKMIIDLGLNNEAGSLFHSSSQTLTKSNIYFMGDLDESSFVKESSILENFNTLHKKTSFNEDYQVFFNKDKKPPEKITNTLQKRIKFLLSSLTTNTTNVFATNLIFKYFKPGKKINEFDYWAEKCWSIHEELLSTVDPEIILVLGNNSFEFVGSKMSNFLDFNSFSGNYQNQFSCRHISGDIVSKKRDLIMIPHLSKLAITQNKYKPIIKWIQKYLHNEPNLQAAAG